MSMKKARLLSMAILPCLIAACTTTHNSAPVVDRTGGVRTVEVPRVPKQADSKGFYMVKRGDTLYQIANEFGQNYRDLVAWNNLSNANDIKVDQVLRVTPPEGSAGGVQTGSVATGSGVEVRPLTPGAGAAAGTNKSGPRGDKRAYSDAALAELQKPDATFATAAAPKPDTAKTEAKPEKPADAPPKSASSSGDEDAVSWMWPADGKIVANFNDGKKGIDIAGKAGQPVYAAGAGKVLYAGSGIRGYGNLVIVKHTNSLLSAYAHNKTIFVKEDQTVNKGQKIAEMGNSDSDSVKLHFEIRQQGKPVDPSRYLPAK
jgi:lipoprotein NlpD